MLNRPNPSSLAALTSNSRCSRYERGGSRCHRPTRRADGWCGTCAGFRRPQKPTDPVVPCPAAPSTREPVTAATDRLPLTSDEAHDPQLGVTRSAIERYCATHGGDRATAEAEIRSLLENLIATGTHQRVEGGAWRLLAREGFSLLLSADANRVLGYSTAHRDRTYGQVKAGVPSRSRSRSGHRRDKGWVLALQDGLPVRFTTLVLRRFARDVLGTEFTRSTGKKVVEAAYSRSTHVQPDPPSNHAGRRRATDEAGLRWHFAYEPGERPAVIHLSWEPGCGPQAAAQEGGS
ncbi:Superfamily I DNA and RNA helicase [Streptomyces zinciresistens K42]|uniref:Superfamily I DNA and RNA helicase n=1 Tax=Streptomyces zinciresistens K42 TaxID=700597 RepID=G2G458_9ACTN|nr:Superfamily I DNA and RNA helicase [Streptomyces zinciresistens K42]